MTTPLTAAGHPDAAPRADDPQPYAHALHVSILVPVHNRCDLTRACFDSLAAHDDPAVSTELIAIDDCSTDETPEYLHSLGNRVRAVRNDVRQCFGQNMNRAARLARGKYLCLLNNDTYVTPGWLTALVDAAERDPSVGVVGNKHLFPGTGKLNHAGMVFDDNGHPWHLYPGLDPDLPAANVSREFQIVTAACWLVPRELFLALGGFDEQFHNGFEDVDFCLRVRQQHRKVYYCAASTIYHYGQSSPGRTDNDKANWEYFKKKWAGRVVPDMHLYQARDGTLPPPPTPVRNAEPAARPTAPAADVHLAIPLELPASFSWIVSRLAVALEDVGLMVSLKPGDIHPTVDRELHPRLRTMMERRPSPRLHVKWNHYWEPFLKEELGGEINAEIFVTNYRYGRADLHAIDRWMRQVVLNTTASCRTAASAGMHLWSWVCRPSAARSCRTATRRRR
jgi:GT2 family glycosyltransferase